jgi:A/G-specific adenine glycosylase
MIVLPEAIAQFQEAVWECYADRGRQGLPWRLPTSHGVFDPYRIMVSEVMLQQTQVPRVIPKFLDFTRLFPDFASLADTSLADVLQLWSGLGYNRRAKYLWQAAQMVEHEWHGKLPRTPDELAKLPGIGLHTAGAILAYSFNQPVVFIETNIRTVVLFHFFPDQDYVTDKQIAEIVRQTLPEPELTREWYWALMDYGSYLKQRVGNLSRSAAMYTKQSRFEGSNRQIRGAVLRLLRTGPRSMEDLSSGITDERLLTVLTQLASERLIHRQGEHYILGD